jgi:hypothetical protein
MQLAHAFDYYSHSWLCYRDFFPFSYNQQLLLGGQTIPDLSLQKEQGSNHALQPQSHFRWSTEETKMEEGVYAHVINERQGYRLRAWHGLESAGQGFMVIDVFLAMDNEENYEG